MNCFYLQLIKKIINRLFILLDNFNNYKKVLLNKIFLKLLNYFIELSIKSLKYKKFIINMFSNFIF